MHRVQVDLPSEELAEIIAGVIEKVLNEFQHPDIHVPNDVEVYVLALGPTKEYHA